VRAGFHKKKGIVMLDHCKTHSVFITGLAAGVVALAAAKPIYADCGQNLDHAKTEEKVDGAWDKGKIDGNSVVTVTAASIHLCEKVDGASQATLTATRGAIVIDGKIDGGSKRPAQSPSERRWWRGARLMDARPLRSGRKGRSSSGAKSMVGAPSTGALRSSM
jgi:hypothetical protein